MEVNIICVMIYSVCAHVSAICTNDFFQEHTSQSLQEEGSVLYFSSNPRTYSTKSTHVLAQNIVTVIEFLG